MNKNALKIENQLLNLFDLEETSSNESDTDESITKKVKISGENALSVKQVGYVNFLTKYISHNLQKTSEFLRLPKYSLDPLKLPLFSNAFDDAKDASFAIAAKGFGMRFILQF